MSRTRTTWLVIIAILLLFSLWLDFSNNITITNPISDQPLISKDTSIHRGLDTLGGLQTLLEADGADCSAVDPNALDVTKQILENRANALGVSEIVMQIAPPCRIVAEFPGVSKPEEVVAALQQTALLEFVDMGTSPLPPGSIVATHYDQPPAKVKPSGT